MPTFPWIAARRLAYLAIVAGWACPSTLAADPTPTPVAGPAVPAAASPAPTPASKPPAATQPTTTAPTTQPAIAAADPDHAPAPHRVYVDEDYAFSVEAPPGWMRSSTSGITVAGNLCRVWSPNSETAILVFRSPSIESMTPMQIADSTAESMTTRAQAEIYEQTVQDIAGKKAAIVLFVGRGTTSGIDGQGNLRVAQYMVVIPRVNDMIVAMLITPEEQLEAHRPVFENLLRTFKIGGEQTEAQRRD